MPQKACERGIYHVMEYAFFRNAPKSKMFIFGSFSLFRIKWEKFNWSRAFFRNAPLFYTRFFFKCPIFPIWFWKQKMNRKWTSSILGHFEKKCICHHMINSSFTYFLGHFMLPPVETFNVNSWKILLGIWFLKMKQVKTSNPVTKILILSPTSHFKLK